MEYTKATAIDYFFNKIDAKEMEFSAIRKTLEGDGLKRMKLILLFVTAVARLHRVMLLFYNY